MCEGNWHVSYGTAYCFKLFSATTHGPFYGFRHHLHEQPQPHKAPCLSCLWMLGFLQVLTHAIWFWPVVSAESFKHSLTVPLGAPWLVLASGHRFSKVSPYLLWSCTQTHTHHKVVWCSSRDHRAKSEMNLVTYQLDMSLSFFISKMEIIPST